MGSTVGSDGVVLAGRTVAVVHEWFGATGGSEKVFLHICDAVPQAQRFVLWKDDDARIAGPPVEQSWLARTPLRRVKAAALPAMPIAWRTLTKQHFDVVISSSHAFAHTVKLASAAETTYLSYVHSPARYLWSPSFDGRGASGLLTLPRKVLQTVDVKMSGHVKSYAVNSREVQSRIQRYWRRDAQVIHPPVAVEFYAQAQPAPSRDYLLGVGRWIGYKNFDLMIEIAAVAGTPLVIAGSGPQEAGLRRAAAKAAVPVSFEVRPSNERLRELYHGARALLYPAHEDFGIVPVEAQACGTPVIGLARGGLLETVLEGETGFLVDSMQPRGYADAVAHVDALDREKIRSHAMGFSASAFTSRLASWIASEVP
jgi:glycosyltransferase involved in cell wall biosynthesis